MTTPDHPTLSRRRRTQRWLEFLLLYTFLPALLAAAVDPQGRLHDALRALGLGLLVDIADKRPGVLIFPILIASTALIVTFLIFDKSFDRSTLWGWRRAKPALPRILSLWALNAALLLGATWLLCYHTSVLPKEAFLRLPREIPLLLLAIWLLYPIWSAFPQEITHRVFFYHRYAALIPNRTALLITNAAAFSWMHALFWNIPALIMTFFGGLFFAWTYQRSRSALAAGIEHALYGNWVFTTGLGWFVYAGSINADIPR